MASSTASRCTTTIGTGGWECEIIDLFYSVRGNRDCQFSPNPTEARWFERIMFAIDVLNVFLGVVSASLEDHAYKERLGFRLDLSPIYIFTHGCTLYDIHGFVNVKDAMPYSEDDRLKTLQARLADYDAMRSMAVDEAIVGMLKRPIAGWTPKQKRESVKLAQYIGSYADYLSYAWDEVTLAHIVQEAYYSALKGSREKQKVDRPDKIKEAEFLSNVSSIASSMATATNGSKVYRYEGTENLAVASYVHTTWDIGPSGGDQSTDGQTVKDVLPAVTTHARKYIRAHEWLVEDGLSLLVLA